MIEYKGKSLHEAFLEKAAEHESKMAIVCGDKRYTWRELTNRIEQLAVYMRDNGIKPGDRVGIWMYNTIDIYPLFCAAILNGAVAIMLNSNLSVKDMAELLKSAGGTHLMFGKTHDTKGLEDKKFISQETDFSINNIKFIDELPEYAKAECDIKFKGKLTDDAFVIFTSGSSGKPKAVVLSQQTMMLSAYGQATTLPNSSDMKALNAAPMFHIYGVESTTVFLLNDNTTYFLEKLSADAMADIIEKENIEIVITVAVMYQKLAEDEKILIRIGKIPKVCQLGGSYISPVEFSRFEAAFPNAFFQNCYGSTETCGLISCTVANSSVYARHTTVGKPNPNVDVKIWDSEKGFLEPGEVGEIITRNTNKNCYYGLPDDKQGIDADGYFHTGDLGKIDEEGNFVIEGRIKDIIIKGGENITPSEVEEGILKYDAVKSCKVFGYRDRVYGENLGACLILNKGVSFDERQLRVMLKKEIGSYKIPVYFEIFDSFPVNANGKIDSQNLHIQMLRYINKLMMSNSLKRGLQITDITVKNAMFVIEPLCDMMSSYAKHLGFYEDKVRKIRLAFEEMLQLRILDNKESIGDLNIQITCTQGFMRVTVSDLGHKFDIRKASLESNLSARIITRMVDDLSIVSSDSGSICYNFDFKYSKDFDVLEFMSEQVESEV